MLTRALCRELVECEVAVDEIIQVLVSNVLHAPDSAEAAASALTTISLSFPQEATAHLLGFLDEANISQHSLQLLQAVCRLMLSMLAQSTRGHPVQIHAKRLVGGLMKTLRCHSLECAHCLSVEVAENTETPLLSSCSKSKY